MKKLDHTDACEYLSRVDKPLGRIMAKSGPCYLQRETTQSIFDALVESIIYQQLNGKVAATILGRVKALYPRKHKARPHTPWAGGGFPDSCANSQRLR